ncbi:nuclear transport factor 2 family protein [Haliea sp. E17]|uniref:nuclear transport factor 2 family protein n=1 Tax=Haliea sp. E17 TaxID=3401576 RepID=UPI003AACE939
MICKLGTFKEQQADRDAIADCLYLYTRAVDRCDSALLREVFWGDAQVYGSLFSGGRDDFVAYSTEEGKGFFDNMTHMISNIITRIQGQQAAVEAYFYGYHAAPAAANYGDLIIAGRYLDILELRDDEWRILEKTILFDWFREYPDCVDWEKGPMGSPATITGSRNPDDRSYALFSRFNSANR